jgi:hypothetical protein
LGIKDSLKEATRLFGWGRLFDGGFLAEGRIAKGKRIAEGELLKGNC